MDPSYGDPSFLPDAGGAASPDSAAGSGDPVLDTEQRKYSPPRAFAVGPASNLVRGYSYGKYSDGYTGYYWER